MGQLIMDHGVSWCFGTSLAPNKLYWVERYSLIRNKRLFPSFISIKSVTRFMISRLRSLMSSADGASLSSSRPRFLLMNIGCPFLINQIECKNSFLRSATFSTLLRIAINSLQADSLAKNNFALSRSFFTSCLVGKSFVTIVPTSLFRPQILQANSSTNECSRENRMLNFPNARSCRAVGSSISFSSRASASLFMNSCSSLGRRYFNVSRKDRGMRKGRCSIHFPLIKSPNEAPPQDNQQEQLSAIVEDLKWLKP